MLETDRFHTSRKLRIFCHSAILQWGRGLVPRPHPWLFFGESAGRAKNLVWGRDYTVLEDVLTRDSHVTPGIFE